ncbi:MAG: hypothetical protein JO334_16360 [Verrucomicrobia bacterium]|nr:hypothetical protein [Verrucomicrobiota bacterium]
MAHIRALRSRLEKQPTDLRQYTSYLGDRTLELYHIPIQEQTELSIKEARPLIISDPFTRK